MQRIPLRTSSKDELIKQIVYLSGKLDKSTKKEEELAKEDIEKLIRTLVRFEVAVGISELSNGNNEGPSASNKPGVLVAMGDDCPIGTLFKQNVQHILEKIFLSLKYSTLKQCQSVCREWNHYLKSDSFLLAGKSVFSFQKWSDVTQTELRLINYNPKQMTTNGEEVVHTNDRGSLKKLFYTTKEGVTKTIPMRDLGRVTTKMDFHA